MIARFLWGAAVLFLLVLPVGAVIPAAGADTSQGTSAGPSPVNLVVDTSGSMAGSRLAQAKSALHTSVDALEDDQPAGLRSYAGGCSDGGILRTPVGVDNRQVLHDETDGLTAGGGTPTPAALEAAVGDLPDGQGIVVLISDGQSTCGDPCPVAERLAEAHGTGFTMHTVGFHAPDAAEGELACMAEATGGAYVSADDEEALADAIGDALGRGPSLGQFVVMGDSYSSGEGAETYYADSGKCHRSRYSWGQLLSDRSDTATLVSNLACSGARIDHLLSDEHHGEEPQVNQLRDLVDAGVQVDTVMLTIGGNDFDFGLQLKRCFLSGSSWNRPSPSCSGMGKLRDPHHHVGQIMDRVRYDVIPAIQAAAPDADVLLVGYPRIFPNDYGDNQCSWLREDELSAINLATVVFTTRGFWVGDDTDAHFVTSLDALEGHELCTEKSYFFPIASNRRGKIQEQGHPTSIGYSTWADALLDELSALGLN